MTHTLQDPIQTLLTVVNHIITQHPNLAPSVELLAQQIQGKSDQTAISVWASKGYQAPSPHFIKQACLLRNSLPNATWIETGTSEGSTTDFLSRFAKFVYSIEPEPGLYEKAKQRFAKASNISLMNDISEKALPLLLPKLSGNICMWLDGHYSGEGTFAGPNDTPLLEELNCISQNFKKYDNISILVDDIRLCGRKHAYGEYPSLDLLVKWAQTNDLGWHIEHDIFIAKSKSTTT